jgi:bifunctional DNA-binding transcriptional regulator/antitoxin component of YhaV-PrlF toxin-antitoxin module
MWRNLRQTVTLFAGLGSPYMPKVNPSGPVATGTANVITMGVLFWTIAGSTVIALALSLWKAARDVLFSPGGAVFAVVWFLCLFSALAILSLRALSKPRKVITEWDCAYCINVDGTTFAFDQANPDRALQLVLNLRNVGNGPIKIRVEEFRLQIGDRVSIDNEPGEIVLARLSPKGMISGTMRRDAVPDQGLMRYNFVAVYGRHDSEFSRRYNLRGDVNFRIEGGGFSGALTISGETDVDI